jgi:prepilin-type N-terminal cleavage/methylation domain-containing protein
MLKTLKKKKGFTLIELIVVIVILAILAVVGMVSMNGFINQANESRALANGRAAYLAASALGSEMIIAQGGSPLTDDTTIKGEAINNFIDPTSNADTTHAKDIIADNDTVNIAKDGSVDITKDFVVTTGGFTVKRLKNTTGFSVSKTPAPTPAEG